ncbi:MAG TPA: glycosyltransferase family 2 protein, partial [Thermoanaerobaculia bacterium]|nr:glycosyltransferase family 2 protein [Thermoanaerobaculia bacterium]
MSTPAVSVVMPVYNGGALLEPTLASILAQTHDDFELVAVDDASTDDSWQRLQAWAARDRRIRLDRHPVNRGHRAASNRAFALARGRYLARHDQDDVSLPERLARQVAYMERHPEVGLLATAYERLHPDGRRVPRHPATDHAVIRWKLLFGMIFCHSSFLLRRDAFAGGVPVYRYAPAAYDYEIAARMARCSRVACLPEPLVLYRMHERGMSVVHKQVMDRSVAALSNLQLRALLRTRRIDRGALEALRRLGNGQVSAAADLDAGPLLFTLLGAFGRLPEIGAGDHARVRRLAVATLLRRLPSRLLPALVRRGLVTELLRAAPATAAGA